jgi:hypothetical protein
MFVSSSSSWDVMLVDHICLPGVMPAIGAGPVLVRRRAWQGNGQERDPEHGGEIQHGRYDTADA